MNSALLHTWECTLRRCGSARAIVQAADGRELSFANLDVRASEWLRKQTVDLRQLRGRAVVFSAPNGIAWLELFLGLLKAGAVIAPLDVAEPLQEQRRLASVLRAAGLWNGTKIELLTNSRRYQDPETCLIKLTSGSTGMPRPLVFNAEQMLADGRHVISTMGIKRRDLNYALIPLGHSSVVAAQL